MKIVQKVHNKKTIVRKG